MMWDEKIDHLKKQFAPTEFNSPFTNWIDIFKKIERKFIVKQDINYPFRNWAENMKNKKFIQSVNAESLPNQLDKPNVSQNYWVVVVMGNGPTSKQYVYDCNAKAVSAVTSIAPGDFFIIDKKYDWLAYFERDNATRKFFIYKSGEAKTPFDN